MATEIVEYVSSNMGLDRPPCDSRHGVLLGSAELDVAQVSFRLSTSLPKMPGDDAILADQLAAIRERKKSRFKAGNRYVTETGRFSAQRLLPVGRQPGTTYEYRLW